MGILAEIVPRFTQLQLYQAVLESQASEHSARMVSMRNASDNAASLAEDLTLVYNKARQAGITAEILDIVGGAEALRSTVEVWEEQALQTFQHDLLEDFAATGDKQASDDLTKLEGIGPKISQALKAAGYNTFGKVAGATEVELRVTLERAGIKLAPAAATWPHQAALADRGEWEELKKLQDSLVGGRES